MPEYVVKAANLPGDAMVRAYLECAEWSGVDDDEREAFDAADVVGWTEDALKLAAEDCTRFHVLMLGANIPTLPIEYTSGQLGHDLWLSRNGHGAGFFDRDILDEGGLGEKLQGLARAMGESYVLFAGVTGTLDLY